MRTDAMNESRRNYNEKNKEKIAEWQKKYSDANKEKIKELSYKPENLLDYNNVVYQRKKKLKKLNIISNENG